MAEGVNRVMLLGNLGADPELRYTSSGQAVLNMRLATTESYLDRDKVRKERTDWHSVVVWGKRAEGLGKFLEKGMSLFIEGSIRTSSYDDKEGNKRYKTEIVAQNVIVARGKPHGDTRGAPREDRPASGGSDRGKRQEDTSDEADDFGGPVNDDDLSF
jgi:single-strand DNA-binding protein